jgi:hypothetical protein
MPSQVEANLIKIRSFGTPIDLYNAINERARFNIAPVSYDNLCTRRTYKQMREMITMKWSGINNYRASTSVDTTPGTIFVISTPKLTANLFDSNDNWLKS